jgi:hypothetical protein
MQAMLAVVGILAVEFLGKGPWWKAPFAVSSHWTSKTRSAPNYYYYYYYYTPFQSMRIRCVAAAFL